MNPVRVVVPGVVCGLVGFGCARPSIVQNQQHTHRVPTNIKHDITDLFQALEQKQKEEKVSFVSDSHKELSQQLPTHLRGGVSTLREEELNILLWILKWYEPPLTIKDRLVVRQELLNLLMVPIPHIELYDIITWMADHFRLW